ncbi:MAG: mechanosensitive ion channel family protein [Phycisphaera sp.]|nr:MAG: mechanosensitive ion channel family protein [Phycisphaera sp.]
MSMLQAQETPSDPAAPEGDGTRADGTVDAAASPGDSALGDPSATVMDTLRSIAESFLAHLPLIVAGVLVVLATLVVGQLARFIARRLLSGVRMRDSLKELIVRFVVLGVWGVGLMIAAMVTFPGLTPTKALTALGVGSIAIGLAFKDIFENFFAGVLILWRFPFENGDWISCNGITGRVVNVTVRNTVLRTVRGELVIVPNVTIYKNPVDVLTDRSHRRLEVIVGVAYGESVADSRAVIEEAVQGCETIQKRLGVQVFAQEFASSSINFEVAWWTGATPLDQRKSRDEVVEAIKSALDNAGIEIPFPYRTLTFKHALGIEQREAEASEGD